MAASDMTVLGVSLGLWSGWMALISGLCLGFRAALIKPDPKVPISAAWPVWLGILFLSIAYLVAAYNMLLAGEPASPTVTFVFTASTASSIVMMVNLIIQALRAKPPAGGPQSGD